MNKKLTKEEEQFEKDKREIKKMVKEFIFLTRDQLIEYNHGQINKTNKVLSALVKSGDIAIFQRNEHKEPIEYVADIHIDKKTNTRLGYQKAFYLYLALRDVLDIGNFTVGSDESVVMSFEVKKEIYDVVRIAVGDEFAVPSLLHMKERYLPAKEREELHRIVMLDDAEQLKNGLSDIEGLEKIVVVKSNGDIEDVEVKAVVDKKTGEKLWYRK